jgi:hypothetical protein
MEFDACSSCAHRQSNDVCDAHLLHEHYNEDEIREIFIRHGFGCNFYIGLSEYRK